VSRVAHEDGITDGMDRERLVGDSVHGAGRVSCRSRRTESVLHGDELHSDELRGDKLCGDKLCGKNYGRASTRFFVLSAPV
jgi:hypothetical protein